MNQVPSHIAIWKTDKGWAVRAGNDTNSQILSTDLNSEILEEAVIETLWLLKFGNSSEKRLLFAEAVIACLKKGIIGEKEK